MEATPPFSMKHGGLSADMFPPPYPLQKYVSTGWGFEKFDRGDQILQIASKLGTAKCIRTFNMEVMIDGVCKGLWNQECYW